MASTAAADGPDFGSPEPQPARAEAAADPLERLENRSPLDRWKAARRHLQPSVRRTEGTDGALDGQRDLPVPGPEDVAPAGEPVAPDVGPADALMRTAQAELQPPDGTSRPVEDPKELPKITEILPFPDYTPETPTERAPSDRVPEEFWTTEPFVARVIPPSVFTWEASNLWHKPLYFEDPQLERYGHTHGHLLQPFVSVARFNTQLVGLPYQMTIHPMWERQYVLGWYRPGEPAPKLHYQIPWNTRAAAVQAGVMTGLFFAIP